jgi:hypothetical protein
MPTRAALSTSIPMTLDGCSHWMPSMGGVTVGVIDDALEHDETTAE